MKKLRTKLVWCGVALLALYFLIYAKTDVTLAGNESTRFAVVQAVGEQGVFYIENTAFKTVDRVIRDGHIYSDKPLPIGFVLGALYKIPHKLFGLNFFDNYYLLVYLVNLLFSGTVNILIFVWAFRLFGRVHAGNLYLKFLLALGLSLGTWIFSYSVTLNNHTPAALGVLGLCIVLEKFRRIPSYAGAAAAGLTAGLIAACDLPTGALFAVAAILAVWGAAHLGQKVKFTLACVSAGLAVGAGLLFLNYYAYGTVMPLYIAGSSGTFKVGIHQNFGKYLFDCLLGARGLFSYQPFLLLAIPGVIAGYKKFRWADWALLGASLGLIIFYLSITNEYGGAAYGFRYAIPAIPVLWYWAGRWVLTSLNKKKLVLAGILAAIGVFTAAVGSYIPFCVAYEGPNSPPGHFTCQIQSTFWGNLFNWSFEVAPDSALTRAFIRHYGEKASWPFLYHSAFNRKDLELIQQVLKKMPHQAP